MKDRLHSYHGSCSEELLPPSYFCTAKPSTSKLSNSRLLPPDYFKSSRADDIGLLLPPAFFQPREAAVPSAIPMKLLTPADFVRGRKLSVPGPCSTNGRNAEGLANVSSAHFSADLLFGKLQVHTEQEAQCAQDFPELPDEAVFTSSLSHDKQGNIYRMDTPSPTYNAALPGRSDYVAARTTYTQEAHQTEVYHQVNRDEVVYTPCSVEIQDILGTFEDPTYKAITQEAAEKEITFYFQAPLQASAQEISEKDGSRDEVVYTPCSLEIQGIIGLFDTPEDQTELADNISNIQMVQSSTFASFASTGIDCTSSANPQPSIPYSGAEVAMEDYYQNIINLQAWDGVVVNSLKTELSTKIDPHWPVRALL